MPNKKFLATQYKCSTVRSFEYKEHVRGIKEEPPDEIFQFLFLIFLNWEIKTKLIKNV